VEPLERRSQILEHAARLFGDRGYHETSISDIIASAGIARGTFYLYFENKRGIFEELVDGLLEQLRESIRVVDTSPGAPSARQQLVDNFTRVLQLLSTQRDLLSILLKSAVGLDREFDAKLSDFYTKVTDAIESSLRLGQQMGLVRSGDTHVAALIGLGAFKEVLHDLLHRDADEDVDLSALAAEVLDVLSGGMLVEGVTIP
jgi:AcrR family transcriptional regulator